MRNGDISNWTAPSIAIRVDNNLINYKESGLKDLILNTVKGRYTRSSMNLDVLKTIHKIARTNISVHLIIHSKYKDDLSYLMHLPVGSSYIISSDSELNEVLNMEGFLYYQDDNIEQARNIINRVTNSELNSLVKGWLKYV